MTPARLLLISAALLGLSACALLVWQHGPGSAKIGFFLLLCGLPAFGAGLIEDLTKRVSPGKRLVATAISAALAAWVLEAQITRTDRMPSIPAISVTSSGVTGESTSTML